MSTGFIWVITILILGGAIATVGDRLGTRIGKARLSLFKMRPRRTATVVTILTGIVISASSLGVLLALDKRLRDGIFEIGRIQRQLDNKRQEIENTRKQLEATNNQKIRVEKKLAQARAEQEAQQIEAQKQQAAAQQRLAKINESLRAALTRQIKTQTQLNRTKGQLSQVTSQYQQAQARLKTVSQQAQKLRAEIKRSQQELQQLIAQRDELIARIAQRDRALKQRDREIAERNLVIAQRENRLQELEKQQQYLEQEARLLGRDLQELRRGNVALFRGQVLAARVVRVVRPTSARLAIEEILREANRNAIQVTQPGVEQVTERVVQASKEQIEKLIQQIDDGRPYVVRILSAGNYVVGEEAVQVVPQVALNQLVFKAGDVLARVNADPSAMTPQEVRQRVELLLGASKFSAQGAGLMSDEPIQIGDNRIQTLIQFFDRLQQYDRPVELQAIAAQNTYTSGPLKVQLLAVANGQTIFATNTSKTPPPLQGTTQPRLAPSPQPIPRKTGEPQEAETGGKR